MKHRMIGMKKTVLTSFTVLCLLLAIFLMGAAMDIQIVKAEPRIWTVDDDGPADFHTIQEALYNAGEGDTIFVKNGTYHEQVFSCNSNVTLLGENAESTIVEGTGFDRAVYIDSDNFTMKGFTIKNASSDNIELYCSGCIIECNILVNSYRGIWIGGSNHLVQNNFVADTHAGIVIAWSDDNRVRNNTVTNCTEEGVVLDDSEGNIIDGNLFTKNSVGFSIRAPRNTTVSGNIISDNDCGIRIFGLGMFGYCTICENDIMGNYYGLNLSQTISNVIYHNNFINNTNQVYCFESVSIWDSGYPSGGNYWSDYNGTDADGDGIGNTPYVIDESNRDRYPLMHLWSSLPVHNINTGSGYATIQEAIDANDTLDRHTIFVEEGTYYENVVVNKSISLFGEERYSTIIDGNYSGNVVKIIANMVSVTNFTMRNSGTSGGISGIEVDGAQCNITHNVLENNKYGIEVSSGWHEEGNNIVKENIVRNNSHYGMWVEYASNNTLIGNIAENNRDGIYLYESYNNILSLNIAKDNNGHGIFLWNSGNATLRHNNITSNQLNFGVGGERFSDFVQNIDDTNVVNDKPVYYLMNLKNLKITSEDYPNIGYLAVINGNTVIIENISLQYAGGLELAYSKNCIVKSVNVTNSNYGIWLYSSNDNTLSRNDIYDNNAAGIVCSNSSNNILFGNTIYNSEEGIYLWDSFDNTIHHNNFINNSQQVDIEWSTNVWDDGVEGNYWDNYTGIDSDDDGIGDNWHEIDENNKDYYPLMGSFHSFNTSLGECVNVVSNSTVEDFAYLESNSTIKLYVSNMTATQTYGFCRICIPHALMNVSNISVVIDDGAVEVLHFNDTIYDNYTHRWIYFAYQHSIHEIDIISEFQSFLILPLFMITTLLAVKVFRRKHTW